MLSGLFVQKDLKLKKSFSKEFKSVQNFDNSKNLTEKINQWVKNATDGLIPNVLNSVNEDAKLILVNGVSFKVYLNIKYEEFNSYQVLMFLGNLERKVQER
jgi:serine protease inhibitor